MIDGQVRLDITDLGGTHKFYKENAMHSFNPKNIRDFYRNVIKKITTDESFERPSNNFSHSALWITSADL